MNLGTNTSTVTPRPDRPNPIPLHWITAPPLTIAVRQEPAPTDPGQPSPAGTDFASQLALASSSQLASNLCNRAETSTAYARKAHWLWRTPPPKRILQVQPRTRP